jgi:hypothetical protein
MSVHKDILEFDVSVDDVPRMQGQHSLEDVNEHPDFGLEIKLVLGQEGLEVLVLIVWHIDCEFLLLLP